MSSTSESRRARRSPVVEREEKKRHREAGGQAGRQRRRAGKIVDGVQPRDEGSRVSGCPAEPRDRGRSAGPQDVVDHLGQEKEQEYRRQGNDRHRGESGESATPVGPEIGEQPLERRHCCAERRSLSGSRTSRIASAARSLPPGGPSCRATPARAVFIFATRSVEPSRSAPSRSRRAAWTSPWSSSGTTSSPAIMLTREMEGTRTRRLPMAKLAAEVL